MYNEKTGEASNTVAVSPFISALHKLYTSCHLRKDLFEILIYAPAVSAWSPSVLILYLWLVVKEGHVMCVYVCVWVAEACW